MIQSVVVTIARAIPLRVNIGDISYLVSSHLPKNANMTIGNAIMNPNCMARLIKAARLAGFGIFGLLGSF